MENLVEIRGLGIKAQTDSGRMIDIIRNVDLDIPAGEIVALIGESGSGKTTLALSIMGYLRPGCRFGGGTISIAGQNIMALSEKQRASLRGTEIAYVPQSAAAAFNPALRIMDQVIEVTAIHRLMSPEEARQRAIVLFRALSLPSPETIGDRYPHQVSGGQLQRLAAAMALISDPKLVIFDEPTTALDVTTQIEVLRAFKDVMRLSGASGVYVSHDLAVVAQIADRIVVLKDGQVQEEGRKADILTAARHPYTRELLAAFTPTPAAGAKADADTPRKGYILEVENIRAGYGARDENGEPRIIAVDSVTLKLKAGQNLGIIGESGCGKSTLARVISGILPPFSGSIQFDGREIAAAAADRQREELRKLQIVFQHADTALNPLKPVGEILGRPLTFYHRMNGKERDDRIDQLLDLVHLPKSIRYRLPSELSGGQKQRINFARALAADPVLILCDEITSALDTVVAAAIVDLLKELQKELSLSYLFISHDISTVRSICDEIVVMYEGQKVDQFPAQALGDESNHQYTRLLNASVPRLDPDWLDNLDISGFAAMGR
ncbi:ABC transporter ATP-binding protein [Thalassospira sp.]|uniref:ABC transporter ATP-binding protein n=1 Tax=Thalassospira sp. TaxID=1912094 RepID=UPI0027365757|nr:ABC transporter ATP-binding protein [Thalassospira sp.]MDP2699846.1 ABC transporter ATP-binding protein [Thalassospira sp.]